MSTKLLGCIFNLSALAARGGQEDRLCVVNCQASSGSTLDALAANILHHLFPDLIERTVTL